MLKDTVASVKASVLERVSSPVAGTFLLSWAVWNWKLLVTLTMGNVDTSARIQTILKNYYDVDHLIKYPLISSAIFILIYPIVSLLGFVIWEWVDPLRRRVKVFLEGKTPLTPEQAAKLRTYILEQQQEMVKLLEGRENELKEMKETLIAKEALITKLMQERKLGHEANEEVEEHDYELGIPGGQMPDFYASAAALTEEQTGLLRDIANPLDASVEGRMIGSRPNPTKTQYNLDELMRLKLVTKQFSSDHGDFIYNATPQGRAHLVENNLL